MEIAGFVVALLAVIVAGASALYARGANARADDANRTADAALDLQARVDAREREIRDVSWSAGWRTETTKDVHFAVRNEGLTDARAVTLVLSHNHRRGSHELGDIGPGEEVWLPIEHQAWVDENGEDRVDQRLFDGTQWRIHWSSPLGQANGVSDNGLQLY